MKKAKFWLVQIAMVAIVSLVFGSPVFADKPAHIPSPDGDGKPSYVNSKPDFAVKQDFADDSGKPVHANANSNKDGGSGGECSSDFPEMCTTAEECSTAGGAWFPDFGGCLFP